jgi:hypothetical protein
VFDLMALQDEIHRHLLAMTLRHALFRAQETHGWREFVEAAGEEVSCLVQEGPMALAPVLVVDEQVP